MKQYFLILPTIVGTLLSSCASYAMEDKGSLKKISHHTKLRDLKVTDHSVKDEGQLLTNFQKLKLDCPSKSLFRPVNSLKETGQQPESITSLTVSLQFRENLSKLTNLTSLDTATVYYFGSEKTLEEISHLTKLQYLDVGYNRISGQLNHLSNLQNLTHLNLTKTGLMEKDFHSLRHFINLERLMLSDNTCPNVLSSLTSLKKLTYLDLTRTTVGDQTEEIDTITCLTNLKRLEMGIFNGDGRPLKDLPSHTFYALTSLPNLQDFSMTGRTIDHTVLKELHSKGIRIFDAVNQENILK